jgi:hypothetical protein
VEDSVLNLRKGLSLLFSLFASVFASSAFAHAPSGALFTTVADGSEVNANIYASKDLVYLDGGPGPGAPQGAAGLNDDTYVFQVTEPSGKTLLSLDLARCRQFVVSGGIITAVVATGCQHVTGNDIDHNALTVQLMPYADTPNNGGEYKAWVVRLGDFLAGCAALGVSNGLNVVDCGHSAGNLHGFIPRHTKTDNYKVGVTNNIEIDTRFIDNATGQLINGLQVTWTDTLGSSNTKYSYTNAQTGIDHFAHIEAVEAGVHGITVADQLGCKVIKVTCYDTKNYCSPDVTGAGTIDVQIGQNDPIWTKYLYVYCNTAP